MKAVRLIASIIVLSALLLPAPCFTQDRARVRPARVPARSIAQERAEPRPSTSAAGDFDVAPYREAAARIIGAALTDDTAYRRLAYLTDRIGNRLSGSAGLEEAVRWATAEMRRDNLDAVRAEPVMVPRWVRGAESLELVAPVRRRLPMLGLGGSTATPGQGITAECVVVGSFDELDRLGERVRGRIVVYDVPFTTYRETVQYRSAGASRAARHGAVAVLVRSVTPVSLQSPHTGALNYADDQPKIPAAAITIEAAQMLRRAQERGENVRVTLRMEAKFLPDAESANVIAEIRGRERPEEIVLVGGHLDSWDVGTGAHDDGGGCIAAWEVVRLLKKLNLRPRRTIRVVLFTNEENGLRGGNGYREAHKNEVANHVLAIESDSGVYRPTGFGLAETATPQTRARVRAIASLLASLDADRVAPDGGGADISPLMREGVTGMSLDVDGTHYFDIHHTDADTFDKVDPRELAACVAAMTVMAYVAAEMPERLDK